MKLSPADGVFETVLFCTDFSENADLAFRYAVRQALSSTARVLHLLHVIFEPDAQFWKTYIYDIDHVDSKARCAVLVVPLSSGAASGRTPLAAQPDEQALH